jgi:hypothetical protein
MVFVFEADSEEEVREVLEGLPLSGWPRPSSGQCSPLETCIPSRISRTSVSGGCEHPGAW